MQKLNLFQIRGRTVTGTHQFSKVEARTITQRMVMRR
jgi:hypothetical protein